MHSRWVCKGFKSMGTKQHQINLRHCTKCGEGNTSCIRFFGGDGLFHAKLLHLKMYSLFLRDFPSILQPFTGFVSFPKPPAVRRAHRVQWCSRGLHHRPKTRSTALVESVSRDGGIQSLRVFSIFEEYLVYIYIFYISCWKHFPRFFFWNMWLMWKEMAQSMAQTIGSKNNELLFGALNQVDGSLSVAITGSNLRRWPLA